MKKTENMASPHLFSPLVQTTHTNEMYSQINVKLQVTTSTCINVHVNVTVLYNSPIPCLFFFPNSILKLFYSLMEGVGRLYITILTSSLLN